jgi:NAD(P)-dependent dehydrogenase (short-subunit alcohol dehydrogenase family)
MSMAEIRPAWCGKVRSVECDVTKAGSRAALLKLLVEEGHSLAGVVHAARDRSLLAVPPDGIVAADQFEAILRGEVVAPYQLTMEVLECFPRMLTRVVFIGSQYGVVAANPHLYSRPETESPIHYSAAKAALHHLTRELAVRLAPRGVTVNCVVYGGVAGRVDVEFQSRYAQLCPMGRMLNDSEVFGPVGFLVSDTSSGMTGQLLVVDGGWTAW